MESNEKVEETLETIGSTGVIFWKVYKLLFYDVSDNTKKGLAGGVLVMVAAPPGVQPPRLID